MRVPIPSTGTPYSSGERLRSARGSVCRKRVWVPGQTMEWRLDDPTGTLEVRCNLAEVPSRDEVGAFLEQVKPIASQSTGRTLLVSGEAVTRRRPLSYPEIATPVLYEAARRRSLGPRTPR